MAIWAEDPVISPTITLHSVAETAEKGGIQALKHSPPPQKHILVQERMPTPGLTESREGWCPSAAIHSSTLISVESSIPFRPGQRLLCCELQINQSPGPHSIALDLAIAHVTMPLTNRSTPRSTRFTKSAHVFAAEPD
jgi:hypothetical protein